MSFNKNDDVRLVDNPTQTGCVCRVNIIGISNSIVVKWNSGPIYEQGYMVAYFSDELNNIELDN